MSVLAPMSEAQPVLYEAGERIARITLNRPERGNGIVPALLRGLVEGVERADLDPSVHVVLLSGNGAGFCGGYDLVDSAEQMGSSTPAEPVGGSGSPIDPVVVRRQPRPLRTWDPMVDYAMMSRNVRAFMTLFTARSRSCAGSTGSAWRAARTWRCARICS